MLYDVTALLFVRISRLQVICLQSNQTLHSGQWTVGPRQYLKLLTSALWILIQVLSLNCFRRNFVFVAQWNFGNIIVSSRCPAELDIDHCWPNIARVQRRRRQWSGDTVAGRRPAWPQRGTCGVRSTWPSSSGRSCSGNKTVYEILR